MIGRPGVPAAALSFLLLAGCENPQSSLNPAAEAAARIVDLWWILFGVTVSGATAVIALLGYAIYRARRAAARAEGYPLPVREGTLLLGAGAAFPAVVLIFFSVVIVRIGSEVTSPVEAAALRIEVIGHQFWWEVRYPELGIVTANEIHIPAGRTTQVEITSVDVIHSFWVPRLHGKLDMNPGKTNVLWLHPDEPGVYRGQCTELCGVQHALMAFLVIAEEPADFDIWVARQQQPAAFPTDPLLQRGLQVYFDVGCSHCHAVRGLHELELTGEPGPDLTHLTTRQTLGAATIDNNRANLGGWIVNPHTMKPGVHMPATFMTSADFHALLGFLESLP